MPRSDPRHSSRPIPVPSDAPPTPRPISVVWCEDDADLRSLFEALWRVGGLVQGWRPHPDDAIHFAANGDEALRLIDAVRPEVFVTDLYHPGPNGLDLLRHAARHEGMALGCVSGATLAFDSVAWVDFEVMKAADLPRLWVPVARVVSAVRDGTYRAHPDRRAQRSDQPR